jgi:hypothetical protein
LLYLLLLLLFEDEFVKAVKISIVVLYVVTPCSVVGSYHRFEGTYCSSLNSFEHFLAFKNFYTASPISQTANYVLMKHCYVPVRNTVLIRNPPPSLHAALPVVTVVMFLLVLQSLCFKDIHAAWRIYSLAL